MGKYLGCGMLANINWQWRGVAIQASTVLVATTVKENECMNTAYSESYL
jgi:hypothetical protein